MYRALGPSRYQWHIDGLLSSLLGKGMNSTLRLPVVLGTQAVRVVHLHRYQTR